MGLEEQIAFGQKTRSGQKIRKENVYKANGRGRGMEEPQKITGTRKGCFVSPVQEGNFYQHTTSLAS